MAILVAVRDLVFRSKIDAAAQRLGVPIRIASRATPLSQAIRELGSGTVLADLGEPGVLDEVRAARSTGAPVRVVGFLGHLQADLARAAEAAGVDEILTRGQLAQRLDDVLTSGSPPSAGPAS